jgi:hypothetical protein
MILRAKLLLDAMAEDAKVSDGQAENNITLQYKLHYFNVKNFVILDLIIHRK